MARYRVKPTRIDTTIAAAVSDYTTPAAEQTAEALTWAADEHVLCALALGWWLYSRNKAEPQRRGSNHALLVATAATILPHLLKTMFDQQRPDRLTTRGHLHGVPISGKAKDAFPSGHAIHVGAVCSAASVLPPAKRNIVWLLGGGLVLTRVLLLAHWLSDVIAGLAIGTVIERLLRPLTGYGKTPVAQADTLTQRARHHQLQIRASPEPPAPRAER